MQATVLPRNTDPMVRALVLLKHQNHTQRVRITGTRSSVPQQVIAILAMQGCDTATQYEIVDLIHLD